MANDRFSIKEALRYGFDSFKKNLGFFIGFMVIMLAATMIPEFLIDKLFVPKTAPFIIFKLVARLIGIILGMVATRISLDIHDKGAADLSTLGDLMPLSPYYLGGKILYGLIVLVGLFLLVVPGCIWAYMFLYVGYLTIDKGLGPVAALQESRAITHGYKVDLFLFSLVVAVLNLIGAVVLLIGLFVTIPMSLMASAYIYRKLVPAESVAAPAIV